MANRSEFVPDKPPDRCPTCDAPLESREPRETATRHAYACGSIYLWFSQGRKACIQLCPSSRSSTTLTAPDQDVLEDQELKQLRRDLGLSD